MTGLKRHPNVPDRRVALSDARRDAQVRRGLYTVQRGERLAIPFDRLGVPSVFLSREMWRQSPEGLVYRPGAVLVKPAPPVQKRVLAWLRDNVSESIPAAYYRIVLGEDQHLTIRGDLYGSHWHRGWANPFDPERNSAPLDSLFATAPAAVRAYLRSIPHWGFVEALGWLSGGKVTTAFRAELIDELVSATGSEFADFDHHEVGTSTQAEANTDTALIATSGIARAAGTPTDADPIYRTVATITADVTESWEEHGVFNNTTGPALMDRSLTGGQSVNVNDQVQYTYEITITAEA